MKSVMQIAEADKKIKEEEEKQINNFTIFQVSSSGNLFFSKYHSTTKVNFFVIFFVDETESWFRVM